MQNQPTRILIIRPSALGDVCRTVPVLVSLRKTYPDAIIDWLVQTQFVPAIRHHPALSNPVPFDRTAMRGHASITKGVAFARSLRKARYDLVLDCQGLARSGLFTFLTAAPLRVGHDDARELAWIGLNKRVPTDATHTVERMLSLVEAIGVEPVRDMRLYTSMPDQQWAHTLLGDARTLVVAPTSRWPGKQWPADRFARLVERALADRLAERLCIVGSHSERAQIAPVLRACQALDNAIDLVGTTTIGQLMAVIERSAGVVANDSAALHMAVGFNKPTVALFGPTDPAKVGPYQRDHEVIRHTRDTDVFGHKDQRRGRSMMERISLDEVLESTAYMLRKDQP